ncbi:MHYT domain-containing protein [Methylobacterium oxalidis]|uniref:histidine kinase n=1 Tax=Methylobacterium oxalidis TaxID=944322 RepID=A0A512JBR6_9HYPH|nr:MHYT domain-containing protein [Methylobacterium oxalidis]GEP07412.1 sensor histidine kinase [Methylobacterium oxalidis]GJE33767.1 Sensor histidine kinase RcsC [Methylobacterium oxalidis]GLS62517.1 sensor histidine kinase [Methylobacterium oxalidis]
MLHAGTHDFVLVALSILIAAAASYTALDLAARMRASSGWPCRAWLATAALAMGGGIWAMHFVAMLAFSLPGLEVGYDLRLTLLSLMLPIAVTGLGFFVVNRPGAGPLGLCLSGLVMGLGIAGMHYTGMSAMRMPADLRYDHLWVAISILIAIGAAIAALWLAFQQTSVSVRLLAAAIMGFAVSGMHYAAMQGSVFSAHASVDHAHGIASVNQTYLALWVTATTFLILVLALAAAMFDRHLSQASEHEAAALRASEQRFRLLLQGVTDYAIFMLDTEGRIANWNAGAERIKGYTAEEIVGSHLSRFYTPEDLQVGVPATALETAAREGRFEAEGWRVRKDGSRFWANVVIDAIRDEQGQLVGFAKVTRDITERKQAQEALEHAREALVQAQKMEAVGQLTGGVAHDFNNLLMAVLGSLELLRKRLPDDPKLTRLLDNAVQGAQRGAVLTQRMLAFARRQELKPETVDLSDLVRGMADLLQRSIGPLVRIETRFPLGLPRVMVDAHQCELALLNLTVNARDAMPEGGTITISGREAAETDATVLPEGRYVCLSVADTGMGMDAETLARAQEPFFTTKGAGKGTGLGLPMVQGLAAQSRGRFLLRSRPGEGTTAEMWLPMAEGSATREEAPSAVPPPRAPMRALTILVVDDDPLVLENTAAMLEDLCHRVVRARSGQEALELLLRTQGLDLVITDQAMPGMTGTQVAERIGAERPGLPVILASGYGEVPAEMHQTLLRLKKPFDQETLTLAVADALAAVEDASKVVALHSR